MVFLSCVSKFIFALVCFSCAAVTACAPASAMGSFELTLDGQSWQVDVEEFESDDISNHAKFKLTKPTALDFETFQDVLLEVIDLCEQVLKNQNSLFDGANEIDLSKGLYFDVTSGGDSLWPYPARMAVDEGTCPGRISFVMPTISDRFSGHSLNDEVLSVLHSWGLGAPEVSFERGTNGRTLAVEFVVLEGANRDLSTIPAIALCIHALANLEHVVKSGPLTFDVANYPKIEIEIVTRSSGLVSTTTTVVGRTVFGQRDGLCVEYEGDE